jgi:hypothetical protein
MEKWEYFFMEIPNNLKNVKIQGEKVDVREYMNMLGNEGWELVGIEQSFPGSGLSNYILFFKRSRSA